MIIAPTKKEFIILKLKSAHANIKQWLLEYVNPLWNVYNDIPEGKLKRKDWWRTGCWKAGKKQK